MIRGHSWDFYSGTRDRRRGRSQNRVGGNDQNSVLLQEIELGFHRLSLCLGQERGDPLKRGVVKLHPLRRTFLTLELFGFEIGKQRLHFRTSLRGKTEYFADQRRLKLRE